MEVVIYWTLWKFDIVPHHLAVLLHISYPISNSKKMSKKCFDLFIKFAAYQGTEPLFQMFIHKKIRKFVATELKVVMQASTVFWLWINSSLIKTVITIYASVSGYFSNITFPVIITVQHRNANSVYIALTVRRKDIIITYPILMIKDCSEFSVQRHNFNTIKVHVLVTLAVRMLLSHRT